MRYINRLLTYLYLRHSPCLCNSWHLRRFHSHTSALWPWPWPWPAWNSCWAKMNVYAKFGAISPTIRNIHMHNNRYIIISNLEQPVVELLYSHYSQWLVCLITAKICTRLYHWLYHEWCWNKAVARLIWSLNTLVLDVKTKLLLWSAGCQVLAWRFSDPWTLMLLMVLLLLLMTMMMMLWQEASDDREEREEHQRQLMMQDETIDIQVALLQEREEQIRQLEVQTLSRHFICLPLCSHVLLL